MSKKISFLFPLILKSIFAWCQQDQDTTQLSSQLKEVIITGYKMETPVKETARIVNVISHDEILRFSGMDLSQLLNNQPDILINGAEGSPGKNKSVYVQGAETQYTQILLDGIPLTDPSGIGGAFDLRQIPISIIDRIEILKGSQSTLYGTDAVAGVINIITKTASAQPFYLTGQISAGSYKSANASTTLSGTISKVSYSFNIYDNFSDGISEALPKYDSVNFDKDGIQQTGLRVRMHIPLSKHLSISPYFLYSKNNNDFDNDSFADAPNTYSGRLIHRGAQLSYDKKSLSILLNFAQSRTKRIFSYPFGDYLYSGNTNNIEGFTQYEMSKSFKLLGGLNLVYLTLSDTSSTISDPSTNIISPYLTFIYHNKSGFIVEGGYRFNHHSKFGNNSNFSLTPAYWINSRFRITANFSTGFKAPTLNELYGQFGANPGLKPEVSQSLETALEGWTLNNAFELRLSYFRRRIKNIIAYTYSSGYINRDLQNDQGFGIRAIGNPWKNLRLTSGYNFVYGELTDKTPAGEDSIYYNLAKRPKHRVIFSIEYNVGKLGINLDGYYNGKSFDYYYNPDNFYLSEKISLKPYFILNGSVQYNYKDIVHLFIDIHNITDTTYMESYGYSTRGINFQAGCRMIINNND